MASPLTTLVLSCRAGTWTVTRSLARPQPCPWAQAFAHGSSIDHSTAIGVSLCRTHAFPSASQLAAPKESFLEKRLRLLPSKVLSSFWVGSGTARRYLQFLSANTPEAQSIFSVSVAIVHFWNGVYSHSGLLHTTGNPSSPVAVLNSSHLPPTTYHHRVEHMPPRPRHEH
jgi:hypothetical protein